MALFIDGDRVTAKELEQRLNSLDCGEFDGGSFEVITLEYISEFGDMYFETERYSIYG